MKIELTPVEARVIGCLIEKASTTPDQYPLSLNALVNACNQKSNRDPMMDLDERAVQAVVDGLSKKHFVMEKSGFGSRVPKYQHRFCNTEFGTLKLDPQELAIVCELLVRGPQTPGELRTRASRMGPFGDVSEVDATLARLTNRIDGPFVTRLAREPGRRDSRYAHLFSGPVADAVEGHDALERDASGASAHHASALEGQHAPASGSQHTSAAGDGYSRERSAGAEGALAAGSEQRRLARVEEEVKALRAELDELKRQLGG
jgi:uncharacterized protein YceH (UPF0502 family)